MKYKQLLEKKLCHIKKYNRKNNFHIFIEDELYMSFPDAFQRERHFNTSKFEKLLRERKVYFYEGDLKSIIDYGRENNIETEPDNTFKTQRDETTQFKSTSPISGTIKKNT